MNQPINNPALVGHGKGSQVDISHCLNLHQPIFKHSGTFLPHWYQEGKIQFITLHLADSLPAPVLENYREKYEKILSGEFMMKECYVDKFMKKVEEWVQKGYGNCILSNPQVQKIIDDALNYYDGKEYDLYDYVIMPNHLHFLILPYRQPKKVIKSFKKYTTRCINNLLEETNERVWQHDYFDRMIRSVNDFNDISDYIKLNPISWMK